MEILDSAAYLTALMRAERPGKSAILAFYDHRVGAIGTDPAHLLIPLDDHICHRGDGLFESLCFRDGRLFVLDAHLERLQNGAQALGITPPCTFSEIGEIAIAVARASKLANGDLRIFLSRGPGGFGVSPSECPRAGLYVVAIRAKEQRPDLYTKGLTAFTSAIPPKQEYLARIKNTNYLPNVFMAKEAADKGMDVAVSFDDQGILGEAAVANIALLDCEGTFVCPEFSRILPGTTLLHAMRLVAKTGKVVQKPIRHEDLFAADEVVLLTSSTLCVGVRSFDDKLLGRGDHLGKPGPFAHMLKDKLWTSYCESGILL
ncbi:MAG: aminotransferase class IV [Desulfovibrionaceae bacterium]|nr:aminotransferase class IV [Desulfovibrionaceae bacterium]